MVCSVLTAGHTRLPGLFPKSGKPMKRVSVNSIAAIWPGMFLV